MKIDYTNLSFTELIDKIESNRFFDIPRMVKEAFRRLTPQEPKYKVYTALLTQESTLAPTSVVLENTLDSDIFMEYIGEGVYKINSLNITEDTYVKINNNYATVSTGGESLIGVSATASDGYISIITLADGVKADSILYKAPIEIRVYN